MYIFSLLLLMSILACATGELKRLASFSPTQTQALEKPPAETPQPVKLAPQVMMPAENCVKFATIGSEPPAYISELDFVLTTVQRPCITFKGESGFYRDSAWTAMGVPCSNYGGVVEWEGKEERPRVVTLSITTDCPMRPNTNKVARFGVSHLGFAEPSKLLAYNPFILQYWSLPSHPDAGTGFVVSVRSRAAVDMIWANLRQQKPINIHLYGRENAWIKSNSIYFVNTNIISTSKYRFRLEPLEIRRLSTKEIVEARQRCDLLRPKRSCHLIF